MSEEIWYDVYHPDGWYMCSTSDGGRPGSVRPTNLPGGDFNPALPRWIPRLTPGLSTKKAVDKLEQGRLFDV